ncbi:uncharacterized protein [Antedon mediterranea]|uniref:uncharacterized protein n=1 Tax=Antedon mediterranea TaxID=105859 RepID=UPI003AF88911
MEAYSVGMAMRPFSTSMFMVTTLWISISALVYVYNAIESVINVICLIKMSSSNDLGENGIAAMLNDARACGMYVENLDDVLTDYFALPSGYDSDNDSENVSSDDDSVDHEDESVVTASSDDDQMSDVESEEQMDIEEDIPPEIVDDAENEFEAANNIAQNLDIVVPQQKVCKCNCIIFNGQKCNNQFTDDEMNEIRYTIQELSEFEKDLMLLGIIFSSINNGDMTARKKKTQTQRKQSRIRSFHYGQKRVCRETFFFLMGIGRDKFKNVKTWYETHGLVFRRKRSGGRRGKHLLKMENVEGVVRFIVNFAAANCILLPGRIPGVKSAEVKLLPTSVTKAAVWRMFKDAVLREQCVALSTFRKLWKELLPYIIVAQPATDLCWICQKNNSLITKQVNVPEAQKTEALRIQETHLEQARIEREFYNQCCRQSKLIAKEMDIKQLGQNVPNSKPITFHYSFDFAQQVHYPANPLQPGPIYFKTPRKCHIFGLTSEGLPSQINYLIDEGVSCGKGANVVISYLHHFFDHYGVGEQHAHLHADNCSGQNKNNAFIQYLAWRVENGLHKTIKYSFLPVGHTKFGPDWCFGLVKRTYRRTFVSSLQDIVDVVDKSTTTSINRAQLVGNESGDVFVKVYDWVSHLSRHYRKFPGIKSYQHFMFDAETPGIVSYKVLSHSEENTYDFCRSTPPSSLPPVIKPAGLDDARKQYLFQSIREFCREDTVDIVCPNPDL